jgi:hypothetical protein
VPRSCEHDAGSIDVRSPDSGKVGEHNPMNGDEKFGDKKLKGWKVFLKGSTEPIEATSWLKPEGEFMVYLYDKPAYESGYLINESLIDVLNLDEIIRITPVWKNAGSVGPALIERVDAHFTGVHRQEIVDAWQALMWWNEDLKKEESLAAGIRQLIRDLTLRIDQLINEKAALVSEAVSRAEKD